MIPFLALILAIGPVATPIPEELASHVEADTAVAHMSAVNDAIKDVLHFLTEKVSFAGAGAVIGSAALLAKAGWGICQLTPWSSTVGNEWLFFSEVLGTTAKHIFAHVLKETQSPFFKRVPQSHHSWHINQKLLSHTPASSEEEQQLIHFLENRWLAKCSGFYASMIDWVCPCFGVPIQVHPDTNGFYARNPGRGFSSAYLKRVDAWKKALPHPFAFPLVLTRPFDVTDYLPSYLKVKRDLPVQALVARLSEQLQRPSAKATIDMTEVLASDDKALWLEQWKSYQEQLITAFKEKSIDVNRAIFIQRVMQKHIGGIRVLPLINASEKEMEEQHRYLLEWISLFGVAANRIELDRWCLACSKERTGPALASISKEECADFLDAIDATWRENDLHTTLLFKGTLHVLRGLLVSISQETWDALCLNPTKSTLARISFLKIKEQLKQLTSKEISFYDAAAHLEQVHADLGTLLEIFSPFCSKDFPALYRDLLSALPAKLKPLATYGLHSSGMASVGGIMRALQQGLDRRLRILYGENAYFENINAVLELSDASSLEEATQADFEEVDLLLSQFNPALKRIDFKVTEYKVERIAETLHNCFENRRKPLTVAIDCTFDFIDSPQVNQLLEEFQDEIEEGLLNVICYRSGLKFDLFGMDNYCGAPYLMIHSKEEQWAPFDALVTDPALQTDTLSANWFCLAYKYAAPQLELYRKLVFDNTQALLDTMPARLFRSDVDYRVIPMEREANLGFVDIKVFGPLHKVRACLLVGAGLTLQCLPAHHPIFYRASVGFYHPNLTILFSEECSTIRLTLGLDPSQVAVLAAFFEKMDAFNGD